MRQTTTLPDHHGQCSRGQDDVRIEIGRKVVRVGDDRWTREVALPGAGGGALP